MVLRFIGQLVDDLVSAFALALTLILILHFWRKPSSKERVRLGLDTKPLKPARVNRKDILALTGSAALLFSVFLPTITMPFRGSLSLFSYNRYVGAVVAGLAVLSLALILTGKYGILCFSGAAALSVAFGLLVHSFLKLSERLASSNNRLAEEIAMRSVRIEYGWDVLVFGAVLVIAAGAIRGAEDDVQQSVEQNDSRA
jgi:hypothetical protein